VVVVLLLVLVPIFLVVMEQLVRVQGVELGEFLAHRHQRVQVGVGVQVLLAQMEHQPKLVAQVVRDNFQT
jgi:hypothetical protein